MLDRNKAYCGDCSRMTDMIDDNSIDLIILDPPYIVTSEKWDKIEVITLDLVREFYRILKESGSIYVWCGIGENSQSLIRWFPIFNEVFYFKDLITWKKQRGMGMRKGWLYTREEIMWLVKDNSQFIWNKDRQYSETELRVIENIVPGRKIGSKYKRLTNVWADIMEVGMGTSPGNAKKVKKKMLHYTPKPVKAMKRIIDLHTKEGDLVLDCFAGSGTTGIAAKEMNRNFILIEKEEKYCQFIVDRIGLKCYERYDFTRAVEVILRENYG